jgi:phage shock protein A
MSFWSRFSDIVGSNAHAVLDGCEHPERMTRYVLRCMGEELDRARRQAASAIAVERSLSRELEQERAFVDHWHARARTALEAGREDLAKQALLRKQEHAHQARSLESEYEAALQTSSKVRGDLQFLETNLAAAHRRQRFLVARSRIARARLALGRTATDGLATGRWRQWENQLADLEATLTAEVELLQPGEDVDRALARLNHERQAEEELRELKKEQKPSA